MKDKEQLREAQKELPSRTGATMNRKTDHGRAVKVPQEKIIEAIVNSITERMIVIDIDLNIIWANNAAKKIYGDEIIGKKCHEVCYGANKPCEPYPCSTLKAFQDGKSHEHDTQVVSNSGEIQYFQCAANMVEIGGEKIVIAVVRDITNRKRVEEKSHRSEERSRYVQKMEAVGRLSGGISHDFGNLLSAIMGFSELALQQLDPGSPIRSDIKQVIKITKNAGKLIRQLMAFSRKQALDVKIINLNTLVRDMGKMLHRLVRENIKIDIDLTPDPVRVKADPGQMEQVIVNLVVNACDAITADGAITIKTENVHLDATECENIYGSRCGKFARLIIRDTGIGMTKELIEHIFEPFFTTKGPGEGTGLGISTVYGIVEQHEGWINVYSEPGQGSSFEIYIPLLDLEMNDDIISRIPTEELKGRQERVLMVEDDEWVRSAIVRLLRDNGYVVLEADNASKALEIFTAEKGEFDVIFSDVILPDQDGLGLIDQLVALKPDLKIIVGSGYIDLKTFGSIIRERKYRLLTKPYTAITLLQTFRDIIEK